MAAPQRETRACMASPSAITRISTRRSKGHASRSSLAAIGSRSPRAKLAIISAFTPCATSALRTAATRPSDSASLAAQAVATVLRDRRALFGAEPELSPALRESGALYAYPFRAPPILDGYADDWAPLRDRMLAFPAEPADESAPFTLGVGEHDAALYLFVTVRDQRVVYRHPSHRRLDLADHLRLVVPTPGGGVAHLVVSTDGPGAVVVRQVSRDWRLPIDAGPRHDVRGTWQPTADGYQVELTLPMALLGPERRLRVEVVDVDDAETRALAGRSASVPTAWPRALNYLIVRVPELERILEGLREARAHVWIVDRYRRVRASVGGSHAFDAEARLVDSIDNALVEQALAGRSSVVHRTTARGEMVVASEPLWNDNAVYGAVLLEQDSEEIRLLEYRTFLDIALLTLAVLGGSVLILWLFAWRLARRIRRLGTEAAAIIDARGRIGAHELAAERDAGDELGELSRTISALLGRLRRYNRFLESLPRTLRHEVTNPLNVIGTSLENLAEVVAVYGEHFALAHPRIRFTCEVARIPVMVSGCGFRIEQLLDKLLDNAVDFTPAGGAIALRLDRDDRQASLVVANDGPSLPAALLGELFESLATSRPGATTRGSTSASVSTSPGGLPRHMAAASKAATGAVASSSNCACPSAASATPGPARRPPPAGPTVPRPGDG